MPRKVIQTSYCTHFLFKYALQTGLGMDVDMNDTAQLRDDDEVVGVVDPRLDVYMYVYIYIYIIYDIYYVSYIIVLLCVGS